MSIPPLHRQIDTGPAKMGLSGFAWALFEGGRNPYVMLCTIYILAPYIATTVFRDPVEGQAAIAQWHKLGGIVVALTAPILGAIADKFGRRKPALFAVTAAMIFAIASLWWALPEGQGGLPIAVLGLLVGGIGVMFAYNEVLHNAMLPTATPPAALPHVSGLGLALGNLASVLLLAFVLWGLAFPGRVHWPFIPDKPLFGLDPLDHETSRIVALLAALWFGIAAIPLFVFTKDQPATGQSLRRAIAAGLTGLVTAIARLVRSDANAGRFLLARMLYVDGKTAILIFAGVVAAGVFDWDLLEMSAYGIILSVFAVLGGLFAGNLDSQIGAQRSILIEITITFACLLVMSSLSPTHIFAWKVAAQQPIWDGPMFQTLPELLYLGSAIVIAISITGAYASSRTLMARLAPKGMEGEFFGLYSLSGAATLWLGSWLVEHFTALFKSQQAGLASTGLLLAAGLFVMLFVKQPARLPGGTY